MVLDLQPMTADVFDFFLQNPENASRNFELIAGEIVEKMVSNPRSSKIGIRISGHLSVWVEDRGLGVVTGADGGYSINGERYIPNAAYISKARQPVQPSDAYNPLAPDLAVEVLSLTNNDVQMRFKVVNYLAAGTLTWVIDPVRQRVEVYQPGHPPKILASDENLIGGDVLPGFYLTKKSIFAE
jgi:Uma2 family endonuclease